MDETFSGDQVFIRKLTDIILANLGNEKFGANELAHESAMSLYRLNRRLHSINKKTTSQFIREIRLYKALEMLRGGSLTVSEVAYKTGFSSPSYFTSCFHEFFGYAPGKVSRSGTENHEENKTILDSSKQDGRKISQRTVVLLSSAILSLLVLFSLFYIVFLKNRSVKDAEFPEINKGKSIAVLPFINLSNDSTDQYIYDGILEEVNNSLTKIHELSTISRTSVEQYRNKTKFISEIGKELNVNYIVEGSGQKSGRIFRLRVKLIEASTDRHIWAKSYEQRIKSAKKFFKLQSRIAQDIASELKTTITPDEKYLIDKVPTANTVVLQLYLKANGLIADYSKSRNESSYQTAVNLYNEALEIDKTFTRSYTGLAKAYFTRYYYQTFFDENFLDSCLLLANYALSIDNKLDEAYYIKGEYYRVHGRPEEALENYDKGLETNPFNYLLYSKRGQLFALSYGDYVNALDSYHKGLKMVHGEGRKTLLTDLGYDYLCTGFIDSSKYYYHEAFALDSNKSAYLGYLAWIEFCQGNFETALEYKKQQKEINKTTSSVLYYSVIPGYNDERYSDTKEFVENSRESGQLNLQNSHRIGYAFLQAGRKKEAEYYFSQQIKYGEESIKLGRLYAQSKYVYYDLASTYAFLGDKVNSYKYLDELAKKKTFQLWMVTLAKNDLLFTSIRKEGRFQKILQIMESKYQAEHERVKQWLEVQVRI
ncbi:MAG: helix-turn-helix domain-containing protein [Bacteroidota bacterium]|nr:helix-turn-helix domain-containing protein [Bacteroidota bacterium]